MRIIRLRSWARFKALIYKQMTIPPAERAETWFRGLSNSTWSLQTTLDRFGPFPGKGSRSAAADGLLDHFRNELIGLIPKGQSPEDLALELLARHHGLPSALMDWTESPYIAAFFAAQDALRSEAKAVAIWVLNLGLLPTGAEIKPIHNREALWFNPRAISQRGVFLRIETEDGSAEGALGAALTKIILPASECTMALRDLEAMNITVRNLFRDLDGAARTAITRFQLERAEHD